MSEESLRLMEIGIAGLALAVASHMLGIVRIELLGVVFFVATLAGQSVAALLEAQGLREAANLWNTDETDQGG